MQNTVTDMQLDVNQYMNGNIHMDMYTVMTLIRAALADCSGVPGILP